MNKIKYYVKELDKEFDKLFEAEDALEEFIKDYWLKGCMRSPEANYYMGIPKKPQKCPYTIPGYTIYKIKH